MSSLTASVDLPPVLSSVPTARHLVIELLYAWGAPHEIDDAALLVTELVANVVDHVEEASACTVEVALSDGSLRVAVADGCPTLPVRRELSTERARGRGLQLVAALADRWGSELHRGGKRVWFELQFSS